MATFPMRAKTAAKKAAKSRRRQSSTTFIQRSRNESSEQKAIWHQVTGAGRSHVRRRFVGLTEDETAKTKAVLEGLIADRLRGASA
jgi:hypothetical protein